MDTAWSISSIVNYFAVWQQTGLMTDFLFSSYSNRTLADKIGIAEINTINSLNSTSDNTATINTPSVRTFIFLISSV